MCVCVCVCVMSSRNHDWHAQGIKGVPPGIQIAHSHTDINKPRTSTGTHPLPLGKDSNNDTFYTHSRNSGMHAIALLQSPTLQPSFM